MVKKGGYPHIQGPEVNTRAVVSQKVKLFSFDNEADPESSQSQIGVMSNFSVNESRNVETVRGIGFGDRIAELVPGVTDAATINATRAALYLSNIMQVFGYKSGIEGIVRSLRHHRWPFDIRQEIVFSEIEKEPSVIGAEDNTISNEAADFNLEVPALVTHYEGCWMNSYSTQFNADQAVVTEDVNINVSDITGARNEATPEAYFNNDSNEGRAYRVKPSGE